MEEKEKKLDDITPFAATNFRKEQRVFGIKLDDRRRHMYVIGKTGMGKSTMLENLVYADIQKGHGVAYVDPHGDTAEKILQWIPENRIKDTLYFNPSDLNNPISFNVLEKVSPEFRNLVASGLVSVYKKLWADSWGPRLEYILRYCILALLDSPDSTLLGINRMLIDEKYRSIVIARVADPVVRSFWEDEFTKWNERVLAEVISPIQNKVGQFLSNSMIRNIVGQLESAFDLREIMDNNKILIMNLSKGRMGEDASALLGAMMITKIQLAAMSRVDIPEDDRKDFYLYVDEFQNFATESFATILSEARKYKLCLTMAHQYIAQLESGGGNTVVRDAVFGNVGTIVTFRVGATDAEFLEKEFAPQFTLEDIVNLPKYKIYLRLMVDGVATDPFSADALPPLASRDYGHGDSVIAYTRNTYSKTKEEVEDGIKNWQKSDGGVVNKEQLIASSKDFHTGKDVLEVYEKMKSESDNKKKKEEEKAKEKAERDARPIVWHGECDVGGEKIDLTFVPDPSRPVLCSEHLRDFRKGSLRGEQVESLMAKVAKRKKSGNTRKNNRDDNGGQKRGYRDSQRKDSNKDNGRHNNNSQRQRNIPPIPGTEDKGRIRIISDSNGEEKNEVRKNYDSGDSKTTQSQTTSVSQDKTKFGSQIKTALTSQVKSIENQNDRGNRKIIQSQSKQGRQIPPSKKQEDIGDNENKRFEEIKDKKEDQLIQPSRSIERNNGPNPQVDDHNKKSQSAQQRDIIQKKPIKPEVENKSETVQLKEKIIEEVVGFKGHKDHDYDNFHGEKEKQHSTQYNEDDDKKAHNSTHFKKSDKDDSKIQHLKPGDSVEF